MIEERNRFNNVSSRGRTIGLAALALVLVEAIILNLGYTTKTKQIDGANCELHSSWSLFGTSILTIPGNVNRQIFFRQVDAEAYKVRFEYPYDPTVGVSVVYTEDSTIVSECSPGSPDRRLASLGRIERDTALVQNSPVMNVPKLQSTDYVLGTSRDIAQRYSNRF